MTSGVDDLVQRTFLGLLERADRLPPGHDHRARGGDVDLAVAEDVGAGSLEERAVDDQPSARLHEIHRAAWAKVRHVVDGPAEAGQCRVAEQPEQAAIEARANPGEAAELEIAGHAPRIDLRRRKLQRGGRHHDVALPVRAGRHRSVEEQASSEVDRGRRAKAGAVLITQDQRRESRDRDRRAGQKRHRRVKGQGARVNFDDARDVHVAAAHEGRMSDAGVGVERPIQRPGLHERHLAVFAEVDVVHRSEERTVDDQRCAGVDDPGQRRQSDLAAARDADRQLAAAGVDEVPAGAVEREEIGRVDLDAPVSDQSCVAGHHEPVMNRGPPASHEEASVILQLQLIGLEPDHAARGWRDEHQRIDSVDGRRGRPLRDPDPESVV